MSGIAPSPSVILIERMHSLDVVRLRETAATWRDTFKSAQPFPHIIIDGFLRPEAADLVLKEFSADEKDWTYYRHFNENKRGLRDLSLMGENTRKTIADLHSEEFVDWLSLVTGVGSLIADRALEDGGGLSETRAGGFLNIHADFLTHPTRAGWLRQVNLLIFLNKDWDRRYNGALELWEAGPMRCAKKITPEFNRCVIFQSTERSYHGHPEKLECPEEKSRKSMALYYYQKRTHRKANATRYQPLPGDPPLRRALMRADQWLLNAYAWLRRRTGMSDKIASGVLKRFQ